MIAELWQDAGLLAIDKPAGLASQPTRTGEPSVLDLLARTHARIHLPHRLDQPASGVLLAVTDPALDAPIARMFTERTIRRRYAAVLAGDGLSAGQTLTWQAPIDGRDARSFVHVLTASQGLLTVVLTLDTGRTHQLRKHAAGAGFPMLGDKRYGGPCAHWAERLCLHAFALSFTHPRTGATVHVQSPLPEAFRTYWEAVGGPELSGVLP